MREEVIETNMSEAKDSPSMQPSSFEIAARLNACDSKCDHFRKHDYRYRKKHLDRRLELAKTKGDGDEAAKTHILAIIKEERDRRF